MIKPEVDWKRRVLAAAALWMRINEHLWVLIDLINEIRAKMVFFKFRHDVRTKDDT